MNPLKTQVKPRRLIEKGRRITPLRTPEAESFRKETSKLDNWINHHRLDEYLRDEK